MSHPSIAIIGAGPAGCMLGRLLHQSCIPCTIFEGDSSPDFRTQGGTLDLHPTTGIAALKAGGLFSEFEKHVRYDGEAFRVADKDLRTYLKVGQAKSSKTSRGRPEIDRVKLREILTESLPEGMIQWGHRLRSINHHGVLQFDNGFCKAFDLVIGADGAWSKVRAFLDPEGWKPFYAGLSGFNFSIPDAEHRAPAVYELVNRGSCFCYAEGCAIMAQQLGDGSINVASWQRKDTDWPEKAGIDPTNASVAKAITLEEFHDWNPKLKEFIENSGDQVAYRSLYMLPVGYRYPHRAGFTLVGDAAHLMTPFAGEGVNLAFADVLKLADAIKTAVKPGASVKDLVLQIQAYEKDMFARAEKAQAMTNGMMESMFFTAGAPRATIESWVIRAMTYDINPYVLPFVYPILVGLVYGYFFVAKTLWI